MPCARRHVRLRHRVRGGLVLQCAVPGQLHAPKRRVRHAHGDMHLPDGVLGSRLLARAQEALQRVVGGRLRPGPGGRVHHLHLHDQPEQPQVPSRLHLGHHHRRHHRNARSPHGGAQGALYRDPRQQHLPLLPPHDHVRGGLLPQEGVLLRQHLHHPRVRHLWHHHFRHGRWPRHLLPRRAWHGLQAVLPQQHRVRRAPGLHGPRRHAGHFPGAQGRRDALHARLWGVGLQRRGRHCPL
mmetsp:Transcript_25597/g.65072  ORF Transcript_25597/g.65072 Transcript_25597/m.65072 type:complete len:239 (-) Transcript_25597:968-1684(-)